MNTPFDFNQDGRPDVALVGQGDNGLFVGDGTGGFLCKNRRIHSKRKRCRTYHGNKPTLYSRRLIFFCHKFLHNITAP